MRPSSSAPYSGDGPARLLCNTVVFDIADARDSKLLQKGWDALLAAKPDAKDKLVEIGLDPLRDIDTVMFAGVAKSDDMDDMKEAVIIVEGRIPKDKLATVPGVTATKYAGTTIWTKNDTDVAVYGDRLFLTKLGKMKGALAGRRDPDLVIAGRTSAPTISGIDDAIKRAKAYAAAGVDAIFLVGIKSRAELDAVAAAKIGKAGTARTSSKAVKFVQQARAALQAIEAKADRFLARRKNPISAACRERIRAALAPVRRSLDAILTSTADSP